MPIPESRMPKCRREEPLRLRPPAAFGNILPLEFLEHLQFRARYWLACFPRGTVAARTRPGLISIESEFAALVELTGRLLSSGNLLCYADNFDRYTDKERRLLLEGRGSLRTSLLWDGQFGHSGLFAPHELSIEPSADGCRLACHLDFPVNAESAQRISCIVAAHLVQTLSWALPTTSDAGSLSMPTSAHARMVDLLSNGMRRLDASAFDGIPIKDSFAFDERDIYCASAMNLAGSGAAGEDALELSELVQEMRDITEIYQRFATREELASASNEGSIPILARSMGIDGLVRSYFEGVPVEDIIV